MWCSFFLYLVELNGKQIYPFNWEFKLSKQVYISAIIIRKCLKAISVCMSAIGRANYRTQRNLHANFVSKNFRLKCKITINIRHSLQETDRGRRKPLLCVVLSVHSSPSPTHSSFILNYFRLIFFFYPTKNTLLSKTGNAGKSASDK